MFRVFKLIVNYGNDKYYKLNFLYKNVDMFIINLKVFKISD